MEPDAGNELSEFQKAISYEFKDVSLLTLALTHPSFHEHDKTKPTNQRLEFLGDSVLSLLLTDELYHKLPHADEGDLTQYRASLIRGESLSQLAKHLNLQKYILLSPSEKSNQGNLRKSTLEDAMEALIGAIYLDGGIIKIKELVLRWIHDLWGGLAENISHHNPKGQLQEWVQENRPGARIKYRIIKESGPDHAKHFESEISIDNETYGKGAGKSKKDAETKAARVAIDALADFTAKEKGSAE